MPSPAQARGHDGRGAAIALDTNASNCWRTGRFGEHSRSVGQAADDFLAGVDEHVRAVLVPEPIKHA
jgi:hypothetical protein